MAGLPLLTNRPGPGERSVDELLQSLLDTACAAVGAQRGMGLVVDEPAGMVRCRVVRNLPSADIGSIFFRIGQGNTGRAVSTGRSIRLNPPPAKPAGGPGGKNARSVGENIPRTGAPSTSGAPPTSGAPSTSGNASAPGSASVAGAGAAILIVPVQTSGKVVAVLNLHGVYPGRGFTEEDEHRVEAIADEAAPRIERALAAERESSAHQTSPLSTLIPAASMKEIQDACSQFLGAPCVFEDARGRCLAPISNGPELCVLLRSRSTSAGRCEASMAAAIGSAQPGTGCLLECHAGVQTSVIPITVRGVKVGALVVMLRYQRRDSNTVRNLAAQLGLDPWEMLARASSFPSTPAERDPIIGLYTGVVARLVGSLAEERLAVQEEQQRVHRMLQTHRALRSFSRRLAGAQQLDPLLRVVTRSLADLSSAIGATLSLLGSDGRLSLRSFVGLAPEVVELMAPSLVDSPDAWTVTSGASSVSCDLRAETRHNAWRHALRRQPEITSTVSFPVRTPDRVLGVLTLYLPPGAILDEETGELLGTAVEQAALAIRSALSADAAQATELVLRQFLYRMARGLGSTLDPQGLAQWIVDFAAEVMEAPHAAFFEWHDDQLILRCANRSSRMAVEKPKLAPGEGLTGQVAASQRLLDVPDLRRDPRFATAAASLPPDAIHYLGAPMFSKGELFGVLAVYSSHQSYTEEQRQLFATFALQAAAAIQNAHSYERQLEIATIVQESFLPRERLQVPGLEVGRIFEPAMESVGGDYYDFVPISGNRAAIVLGDVSGKGIRAATYTAMGKYVLRAYAYEDPQPYRVVQRMNSLLADQMDPGTFITLFFAVFDLDAMQVTYVNAGHPDGLLYRPATAEFIHLPSTGMMVGAIPGEHFEERKVALQPGDIITLYTDGVIEARRGDELFGTVRLMEFLQSHSHLPPDELAASLYSCVKQYHTTGISDDTCILVVRCAPSASSGPAA